MAKKLVIVESPAKAKTIGKLLGRNYKVLASVGHIRDLPKSSLGIDIENNYEPKYITIRGKGPIMKELRAEGKKADKIYLATDPDREGEAISWHLAHMLDIDEADKVRVEFNEITKEAVKNAIKNPREIDRNLVDAQQARRVLDRLVGYKISPLLWRKIRKGLSAGRVQSVAVKLICDREEEIDDFIPQEYWTIGAKFKNARKTFDGNFYGVTSGDKKDKKLELTSKEEVDKVLIELKENDYIVREVNKGSKKRNPFNPFTTSTLQQEASKKLGFTTKKTMMLAQQLYEGIQGKEGLITYMRTDSIRISDEAVNLSRTFINESYGKEYSNGGNTFSKNKKKGSQDAHEAIRPTSVYRTPQSMEESLTKDQFKLYDLIWRRFVASQMSPAQFKTISLNIVNGIYVFRASGSKLDFDGFLKVYGYNEKELEIPDLEVGNKLDCKEVSGEQHFTQPPPRYTEASLIKIMEELGIGRPSTFSPTITTILSRNYVILENKAFMPTELGVLVNELLIEYFEAVINEEFTANLEENLDLIADGDLLWKEVVDDFYKEFRVFLEKAEDEIKEIEIKDEVTEEICEKCGKNMVIKHGRFGKFLACPGYPDCRNTKAIVEEIGVECPECGQPIIKRKSKNGRVFYGCKGYPECEFVSWQEPIDEKCPECGSIMTIKKNSKKDIKTCINKDCGYKKIIEK